MTISEVAIGSEEVRSQHAGRESRGTAKRAARCDDRRCAFRRTVVLPGLEVERRTDHATDTQIITSIVVKPRMRGAMLLEFLLATGPASSECRTRREAKAAASVPPPRLISAGPN